MAQHLAFRESNRIYSVLATLLSLPELFEPGVDTWHKVSSPQAPQPPWHSLLQRIPPFRNGPLGMENWPHSPHSEFALRQKKRDVQVSGGRGGNGAMRSWHSIGADCCAGPGIRQAKQRKHLGRERKGKRPRGRRKQGRGTLHGLGRWRVALVPEGFQVPVGCSASCLGFQRSPTRPCSTASLHFLN